MRISRKVNYHFIYLPLRSDYLFTIVPKLLRDLIAMLFCQEVKEGNAGYGKHNI